MRVPGATYRLQLGPGLGFAEARALVPYLDRLGITDLYLSPVFRARSGSPHGYDVTDPGQLNPELGSPADFEALAGELARRGMGLILDLVPNHMAASPENPWWRDVLEHGPASVHAHWFDIDWRGAGCAPRGRVLLPILGDHYGRVLERGELRLGYGEGGFHLRYFETTLPLDPRSYAAILEEAGLAEAAARFRALPGRAAVAPEEREARRRGAEALKEELRRLLDADPGARDRVDTALAALNGTPGDPAGFAALDALLEAQAWRLAFWRLAGEEVNYRRFFDIGDLVGVRVEEPDVFEATHALALRLVREGKATGLRVDHVDGLRDPGAYLERLRRAAGEGAYIVVEKILAEDEALPSNWPVAGATGYAFMNDATALLVDPRGLRALDRLHARLVGPAGDFAAVSYAKRRQVMDELFPGEVRELTDALCRLARRDRRARDIARRQLGRALVETTASLDVYRTYVRGEEVGPGDRRRIERALAEAGRRGGVEDPAALEFLGRVLLLEAAPETERTERLSFVLRWQQFTGPVMAKGVEDSALYVHTRFIALNEVGGDPGSGALEPEAFHARRAAARELRPAGLNATATHDAKRGEDVRARLAVLPELAGEWGRRVRRWRRWNRGRRERVDGRIVPDANEEYFLYQTLAGAWPLDPAGAAGFRERLEAYLIKAAREAKVHTSWTHPVPTHEAALVDFARRILEDDAGNPFLPDLLELVERIALPGVVNSLAQLVLKIAAPGVPDFYQGTELWSLALVDPDNRRPVDFEARRRMLEEVAGEGYGGAGGVGRESPEEGLAGGSAEGSVRGSGEGAAPGSGESAAPGSTAARARALMGSWRDGRIKLWVTGRALALRRARPEPFLEGEYVALRGRGRRGRHVLAFARRRGDAWVLAAVPLRTARLAPPGTPPVGAGFWGRTAIALPAGAPSRWTDALTGEVVEAGRGRGGAPSLACGDVFGVLPVAVLEAV